MSSDWQDDVTAFHRAFCPEQVAGLPTMPDRAIRDLRVGLIIEELQELGDAFERSSITSVADAIADLLYVVLGTAVACGIDIGPVWNAVHEANMAKVGGERRADGKWLKPTGWQPPDIAGILARQKTLGSPEQT
jgi:predicted HAD superfamily Cof-like phosphohydrolase